jgi:hypothetical protein
VLHFPSQAFDAAFQGMVLQHWRSPGYEAFVRTSMAVRTPFANLLDALPAVGANGALPLAGYPELLARMHDELRRSTPTPAGSRAIDRFRVRWIVMVGDLAKLPRADGLREAWRDAAGRTAVLENTAVRPLYEWQPGGAHERSEAPALVRLAQALPWVRGESQGEVDVEAPAAGHVFVAIPYYPGWTARVDGVEAPVLPGAPLGMRVPVAAGGHRVELCFVPAAFHAGVLVTLASVASAISIWRRGSAPRRPRLR